MHPVETFELVLALLAATIALHWAASRIGFPPSAALLLGGGALAFLPGIPEISLDPELARDTLFHKVHQLLGGSPGRQRRERTCCLSSHAGGCVAQRTEYARRNRRDGHADPAGGG